APPWRRTRPGLRGWPGPTPTGRRSCSGRRSSWATATARPRGRRHGGNRLTGAELRHLSKVHVNHLPPGSTKNPRAADQTVSVRVASQGWLNGTHPRERPTGEHAAPEAAGDKT